MPEAVYFLKRGDKLIGPHNLATIKKLSEAAKIKPTDLISRTKEGPWHKFGDVQAKLYGTSNNGSKPTAAKSEAAANSNVMPCPDCEGKMSRKAQACPHCGSPNESFVVDLSTPKQVDDSFGGMSLPPASTFQHAVAPQPRYLQTLPQQKTPLVEEVMEEKRGSNVGRIALISGACIGAVALLGLFAFFMFASVTPAAIKQAQVDRIFSGENNESELLVAAIEKGFSDKGTLEHIQTDYAHTERNLGNDKGGSVLARVRYRLKEGGEILEHYFHVSYDGQQVVDSKADLLKALTMTADDPMVKLLGSDHGSELMDNVNSLNEGTWRDVKASYDRRLEQGWNAADVVAALTEAKNKSETTVEPTVSSLSPSESTGSLQTAVDYPADMIEQLKWATSRLETVIKNENFPITEFSHITYDIVENPEKSVLTPYLADINLFITVKGGTGSFHFQAGFNEGKWSSLSDPERQIWGKQTSKITDVVRAIQIEENATMGPMRSSWFDNDLKRINHITRTGEGWLPGL